jgi:hypothetical protein
MQVAHINKGAELIASNEFSKHFKYNDIEMFIAKAFDEDTEQPHFLIHSIPSIPEIGAHQIQYPISFYTEQERNEAFDEMNIEYAEVFLKQLIASIKERNDKANSESNSEQ